MTRRRRAAYLVEREKAGRRDGEGKSSGRFAFALWQSLDFHSFAF